MEIRSLEGPLSERDESGDLRPTRRGQYRNAAIKILESADFLDSEDITEGSAFMVRGMMSAMIDSSDSGIESDENESATA